MRRVPAARTTTGTTGLRKKKSTKPKRKMKIPRQITAPKSRTLLKVCNRVGEKTLRLSSFRKEAQQTLQLKRMILWISIDQLGRKLVPLLQSRR